MTCTKLIPQSNMYLSFLSFSLLVLFNWNWLKIKQKLSNTLRLNFCYLKIKLFVHPPEDPKIIGHILKKQGISYNRIIWLIIKKRRLTVKNRSHIYNINRRRSRIGHKYTNKKKCHSSMMVVCIKQHPSNIWNSLHAKVKQSWGLVEKKCCLLKKRVFKQQYWWA